MVVGGGGDISCSSGGDKKVEDSVGGLKYVYIIYIMAPLVVCTTANQRLRHRTKSDKIKSRGYRVAVCDVLSTIYILANKNTIQPVKITRER